MGNAPVNSPPVYQLPGGHKEEDVHQNGTSNWCKEYAYSQQSDRLLFAD